MIRYFRYYLDTLFGYFVISLVTKIEYYFTIFIILIIVYLILQLFLAFVTYFIEKSFQLKQISYEMLKSDFNDDDFEYLRLH